MDISTLLILNPKVSIFVLGLLVSFCITVITRLVTNQERMRVMKERQKSLQAEMKKHKDNPDKLMELNKEMMKHSMELMKHSFKPMLITWLPIIFLFRYLHGLYDPLIGKSWIIYYILGSIIGSIAFRKLFKLQ